MSLVSGDPLISPCCGPSTLASLPWLLICLVSTHFSEAPESILPCLHQTVALCQPLGVGIVSSQSAVRFTPADLLHSLCRYIKSYLSSTLSRMFTPTWQLSSTRQPFHIIPFNISEWCLWFTYVWAAVKIQTFPLPRSIMWCEETVFTLESAPQIPHAALLSGLPLANTQVNCVSGLQVLCQKLIDYTRRLIDLSSFLACMNEGCKFASRESV